MRKASIPIGIGMKERKGRRKEYWRLYTRSSSLPPPREVGCIDLNIYFSLSFIFERKNRFGRKYLSHITLLFNTSCIYWKFDSCINLPDVLLMT